MLSITQKELEKALKKRLTDKLDIKYPEEAVQVIADVLNDILNVELLLVWDEEMDEEEGAECWVDCYFTYSPYDTESAYLKLYTKWYNIGELWAEKINTVKDLMVEYSERKKCYVWNARGVASQIASLIYDVFKDDEFIQIDLKDKKRTH